ncbi:EamA family transporter RarD [Pseudomonas matsuisoli]|uniref:Membrane protein n=1 Tax=Pseudomonas matsuisoli TaxID=1515666 RepID=A0A917V0G1_9PSED|nr:EamA family transporter RarD [Pseudomonas matsuisoli]GGK04519.1 membrane protein [Pseudomonas matsuisoli]
MSSATLQRGYLLGLTAYTLWGLFPIYLKLLSDVPALEVIVHRVLWSALLGSFLLLVWKHPGWWRELLARPRLFGLLAFTGLLIAGNWLIYIWAVNHNRMIEASLGYYINPLMNVLLGMVVLGERLRRLQWVAVILAALGVLQQLLMLGTLPWISLALAMSFSVYGLVRKKAPVAALPGLVVETWMLVPVVIAMLLSHPEMNSYQPEYWLTSDVLFLSLSGPVTLIPLLCFNAAARYLPYATLGFLQYIGPTLVLGLAVFVYGEPFDSSRLFSFICIWIGLAIYSLDAVRTLRRARVRLPPPSS